MRTKTPSRIVLAAVCSSFLFLGCGGADEGPDRYHLSGTVNYDGKPIPKGTIKFTPDAGKGNKGPQGSAQIVDGKYSTKEQGGTGVIGGAYKITITGYDGNADPNAELPMGQPLFKEYQIDKDLPEMPEDKEKPLNEDFQVPKQPASGTPRRGTAEPA